MRIAKDERKDERKNDDTVEPTLVNVLEKEKRKR